NKQLKDEIAQRKLLERELLENSNNIMTRIGQDIHDDLCQDIAGIGVMAAVLKNALKKDSLKAERAMAEQISQTALSSAYNAKQIARDLYPADLEENGIMNAVYQLAHLKNYPKDVVIDLDIQPDFFVREREKAFQLYRIIQESLNNSIKHSQATKIKIGMYMDHGMVTVEVSDNGVGFDSLKAGKSEGMGLKILKYRANLIGARLRIHSSAEGTVVSCRVSR
ncbi:MAG: ATP-binding protein, partial [Sphaerochaeta sp.]|nr:ATP-binding protein [Sphaerochaeta sp.]